MIVRQCQCSLALPFFFSLYFILILFCCHNSVLGRTITSSSIGSAYQYLYYQGKIECSLSKLPSYIFTLEKPLEALRGTPWASLGVKCICVCIGGQSLRPEEVWKVKEFWEDRINSFDIQHKNKLFSFVKAILEIPLTSIIM